MPALRASAMRATRVASARPARARPSLSLHGRHIAATVRQRSPDLPANGLAADHPRALGPSAFTSRTIPSTRSAMVYPFAS